MTSFVSLCALATFERSELKSLVVDNVPFQKVIELVPEARNLLGDFYSNNYASCLQQVALLRPLLDYDMYLHSHIATITLKIRERALVDFTRPFKTLFLKNMAVSFNTTVNEIEKECVELIVNGKLL